MLHHGLNHVWIYGCADVPSSFPGHTRSWYDLGTCSLAVPVQTRLKLKHQEVKVSLFLELPGSLSLCYLKARISRRLLRPRPVKEGLKDWQKPQQMRELPPKRGLFGVYVTRKCSLETPAQPDNGPRPISIFFFLCLNTCLKQIRICICLQLVCA